MRLTDAIAEMTDLRHPTLIQYPLVEGIAIALCALLAGADDWHETRYYLSSACLTAAQFQRVVSLHWGIENQVHFPIISFAR